MVDLAWIGVVPLAGIAVAIFLELRRRRRAHRAWLRWHDRQPTETVGQRWADANRIADDDAPKFGIQLESRRWL